MIKLQDFARDCGVTDRAIQKHLKKHEKALEGHFHRRGPNGTWLDETAQDYIRSLMKETPVVVSDATLLREKAELQEKYSMALEQIVFLQQQNKQLELENEKIKLLEAQNDDLSADNEAQRVKIAEIEKKAVEEVKKAKEELEQEKKHFEDEKHLLQNEIKAEKNRKLTIKERWLGRKIGE